MSLVAKATEKNIYISLIEPYLNLIHPGENRLRYFQLLLNGTFTPRTLPVGGEEARQVSPRSLAEALLVRPPLLCWMFSSTMLCCI